MARRKGSKNLINVGYGSKKNKFGVRFTASEISKFKNEVQRLNKKQQRYNNQMKQVRQSNKNAVDSRIPVEPLFQTKTTSLQKFRSKDEFKEYMSRMRRQGSKNYINYRYKVERSNYKKAIESVFSKEQARQLNAKINKIPLNKLHEAFVSKKLEHTGFVYYDPDNAKFNQLMGQVESLL